MFPCTGSSIAPIGSPPRRGASSPATAGLAHQTRPSAGAVHRAREALQHKEVLMWGGEERRRGLEEQCAATICVQADDSSDGTWAPTERSRWREDGLDDAPKRWDESNTIKEGTEVAQLRAAASADEADKLAWEHAQAWQRRPQAARRRPWHSYALGELLRGRLPRGTEELVETPPHHFLVACDIGDPISAIHLGASGVCMVGTVQGKVWLSSPCDASTGSRGGRPRAGPRPGPPGRPELLAGFSDSAVRGVFADEECCYATLGEMCRGWERWRPYLPAGSISFRSLENKGGQTVKYVLQRRSCVCLLFPLSSTLVDVSRLEQHHRPFKLIEFGSPDEVAPCDFDGVNLALIHRAIRGGVPVFHVVHLETDELIELSSLPKAVRVSLLRLWGADCVVCAVDTTLLLYDYRKQRLRACLEGHQEEIIAVDAQDPQIIATLSTDAVVKLWHGPTGRCTCTVRVLGANFFLGYPYFLALQDQRVLFSCDEGVYLVELDATSDEV